MKHHNSQLQPTTPYHDSPLLFDPFESSFFDGVTDNVVQLRQHQQLQTISNSNSSTSPFALGGDQKGTTTTLPPSIPFSHASSSSSSTSSWTFAAEAQQTTGESSSRQSQSFFKNKTSSSPVSLPSMMPTKAITSWPRDYASIDNTTLLFRFLPALSPLLLNTNPPTTPTPTSVYTPSKIRYDCIAIQKIAGLPGVSSEERVDLFRRLVDGLKDMLQHQHGLKDNLKEEEQKERELEQEAMEEEMVMKKAGFDDSRGKKRNRRILLHHHSLSFVYSAIPSSSLNAKYLQLRQRNETIILILTSYMAQVWATFMINLRLLPPSQDRDYLDVARYCMDVKLDKEALGILDALVYRRLPSSIEINNPADCHNHLEPSPEACSMFLDVLTRLAAFRDIIFTLRFFELRGLTVLPGSYDRLLATLWSSTSGSVHLSAISSKSNSSTSVSSSSSSCPSHTTNNQISAFKLAEFILLNNIHVKTKCPLRLDTCTTLINQLYLHKYNKYASRLACLVLPKLNRPVEWNDCARVFVNGVIDVISSSFSSSTSQTLSPSGSSSSSQTKSLARLDDDTLYSTQVRSFLDLVEDARKRMGASAIADNCHLLLARLLAALIEKGDVSHVNMVRLQIDAMSPSPSSSTAATMTAATGNDNGSGQFDLFQYFPLFLEALDRFIAQIPRDSQSVASRSSLSSSSKEQDDGGEVNLVAALDDINNMDAESVSKHIDKPKNLLDDILLIKDGMVPSSVKHNLAKYFSTWLECWFIVFCNRNNINNEQDGVALQGRASTTVVPITLLNNIFIHHRQCQWNTFFIRYCAQLAMASANSQITASSLCSTTSSAVIPLPLVFINALDAVLVSSGHSNSTTATSTSSSSSIAIGDDDKQLFELIEEYGGLTEIVASTGQWQHSSSNIIAGIKCVYTTYLNKLLKAKEIDEAMRVVAAVSAAAIASLSSSPSLHGTKEEEKGKKQEMVRWWRDELCKPIVLQVCAELLRQDKLAQVFSMIKKTGLMSLSLENSDGSFSLSLDDMVVSFYLDKGEPQKAAQATIGLIKLGCKPQESTYLPLLLALERAGNPATISTLIARLLSKRVSLPPRAMMHLVKAHLVKGDVDSALSAIRHTLESFNSWTPAIQLEATPGLSNCISTLLIKIAENLGIEECISESQELTKFSEQVTLGQYVWGIDSETCISLLKWCNTKREIGAIRLLITTVTSRLQSSVSYHKGGSVGSRFNKPLSSISSTSTHLSTHWDSEQLQAVMNAVIQAYADIFDPLEADAAANIALSQPLFNPNTLTYNILIRLWGESRDYPRAVHWYERLLKDKARTGGPDIDTYLNLIYAVRKFSFALSSQEQKDLLKKWRSEVYRHPSFKNRVPTYLYKNWRATVQAEDFDPNDVSRILEEMDRQAVKPDMNFFKTLLAVVARTESKQKIVNLFKDFQSRLVNGNIHIETTNTTSSSLKPTTTTTCPPAPPSPPSSIDSVKLSDYVKDRAEIRDFYISYMAALSTLHGGDVLVEQVLDKMNKEEGLGDLSDMMELKMLVTSHLNSNNLAKAYALAQGRHQLWNIIMNHHCEKGQYKECITAVSNVDASEVDTIIISVIMKCCSHMSNVKEAQNVFLWLNRGIQPQTRAGANLLKEYERRTLSTLPPAWELTGKLTKRPYPSAVPFVINSSTVSSFLDALGRFGNVNQIHAAWDFISSPHFETRREDSRFSDLDINKTMRGGGKKDTSGAIWPPENLYNSYIEALLRHDEFTEALNVLEKMSSNSVISGKHKLDDIDTTMLTALATPKTILTLSTPIMKRANEQHRRRFKEIVHSKWPNMAVILERF